MGKKLTSMTWDDMEKEMSIAGSPRKVSKLGETIMCMVELTMDATNRAELTNIEFALQRVLAEIKLHQRIYDKNHVIINT